MAISFERLNDDEGLIVTCTGLIRAPELIDAIRGISTDELLQKRKYQLWDLSAVENFSLTSDDIRRVSEVSRSLAAGGVRRSLAAIAQRDVIYGQLRQWLAFSDGEPNRPSTFAVFRTRAEAEAWTNTEMIAAYGEDAAPFERGG